VSRVALVGLGEVGLMSTATAARQAWAAGFASAADPDATFAMIDAVRAAMEETG
jgi:hypothetical protein